MKIRPMQWLILAAALSLAACAVQPARLQSTTSPRPTSTLPAQPTATAAAPTPYDTGPSAQPAAATAAQKALAETLQQPLDAVKITEISAVEWPDACLGIVEPDVMCAQVITPGYRIRLQVDGQTYEYHTNQDGSAVRAVVEPAASQGAEADALLTWRSSGEDCRMVTVYADGLTAGGCNDQRARVSFANNRAAEELEVLLKTFAPFQAQTPGGEIDFRGQGSRAASPAEQRSLAEWARTLDGDSQPLLTWSREGGIAGFCDRLTIFASGFAYAETCRAKQEPARVRLTEEQLTQLYTWADTFGPVDWKHRDPATADAMSTSLSLAGLARKAASPTEVAALQRFAAQVFAATRK